MNRIGQPGPADEFLDEPVDLREPQAPNPLLKIHQLLRGRYVWAILLGVILAGAGAWALYHLPIVQPTFTSPGLIQIKPALDPVLYQTAFNSRLADYDQFLESQVPILKSQRIILQAMALKKDQLAEMDRADLDQSLRLKAWDDKTWADVAPIWGSIDNTEQIARLTEGLDVTHPRNTQVLQISFRDRDATLAPVVVKLVIAAYKKLYDVDVDNYNKRWQDLTDKENGVHGKPGVPDKIGVAETVKSLKDSIKVDVGDYGSEEFLLRTLEQKQTSSLAQDELVGNVESQLKAMTMSWLRRAQELFDAGRVNEADAWLSQVEKVWPDLGPKNNDPTQPTPEKLRKQISERNRGADTAPTSAELPSVDLTAELAAATDQMMAGLLMNLTAAQHRLNTAQAKYGPLSDPVRSAKAEVDSCQKDIDERLEKLKAQKPSETAPSVTVPGAAAAADNSRLTLVDANDRLKQMRELRTTLNDETKVLQKKVDDVQAVSAKLQTAQQELDILQSTKHKLEFEGVQGGRTEVISPGDKPTRSEKDRRNPVAVAGGMGGLALGLGIFALIGLFDRRLRTIADAREKLDGSQRILGILPALPKALTGPDQASAVAFAVHHIRTLLQLGGTDARSTTFAITSAAPQDGKTSLTMALGMSYAASGAKTLLIDTDVIGAGLSFRMGAVVRPRLGSILLGKGLIDHGQLDEGLAQARQTGNRIGRALVSLGFINPAAKTQALTEQAVASMGFLDMLDGHALADCMVSTDIPRLSVMPVGNTGANHIGRISVDAVRRIIAEARKEFDIVLFDTGPLLGSLEAGVVAASVDEVIITVARGQQIPLLDQTFQRLRQLEAHVAGIVFNRARIKDIERSGYSSSIASERTASPPVSRNGDHGSDADTPRRLGPIAGALAIPSKPEEDQ